MLTPTHGNHHPEERRTIAPLPNDGICCLPVDNNTADLWSICDSESEDLAEDSECSSWTLGRRRQALQTPVSLKGNNTISANVKYRREKQTGERLLACGFTHPITFEPSKRRERTKIVLSPFIAFCHKVTTHCSYAAQR